MKRFLNFLLVMCIVIALVPVTNASAAMVTSVVYNGYYYIEHVDSDRYVEVDPENYDEEEESLRIWQKTAMRQTQVFTIVSSDNGWIIASCASGKVVGVENSSTKNYASIVQEDYEDKDSQRWIIVSNSNGTVSFKNKKSGLYMNVYGRAKNGAELVQYKSDADQYNLHRLQYSDVVTAKWERSFTESEVSWNTDGSSNVVNKTEWVHSKYKNYYPTVGEKYLKEVEYFTPDVVKQMVEIRQQLPKYWEDVKNAVEGVTPEDEIPALMVELGFADIPYIDNGLGILRLIWNNRYNDAWADFLKAASPDRYGNCKGLIVYHYDLVTERGEKTYSGYKRIIETVEKYEYGTWDGTNLYEVEYTNNSQTGKWRYVFK